MAAPDSSISGRDLPHVDIETRLPDVETGRP
jgi:hypothetical protein